jgi:hypothetical protein
VPCTKSVEEPLPANLKKLAKKSQGMEVVYKMGDKELVEEVREGGFIQLRRN